MILTTLAKPIITNIIVPHGITDIVHAKATNHLKHLTAIYIGSVIASISCPDPFSSTIHPCFTIASIVHFRNDICPKQTTKMKIILASLFVFLFYLPGGFEFFLLFMCTVHVPKHYLHAWTYIRTDIPTTICSVVGTCIVANMAQEHIPNLSFERGVPVFAQFLAIAHIVYTEWFVRKEAPRRVIKK